MQGFCTQQKDDAHSLQKEYLFAYIERKGERIFCFPYKWM